MPVRKRSARSSWRCCGASAHPAERVMLAGLMIRNPVAAISLFLGLFTASASAGTIYVNAALGSGANNGSSWADAYQGSGGLQSALAVSVAGDQIWVAQG